MSKEINKIELYVLKNKIHNFEIEYFNFHKYRYNFLISIIDRYSIDKNILDIGAGYQHFLLSAKERGFSKLFSIDLPGTNNKLDDRSKEFRIITRDCNLEKDEIPFNDNFFDIIVCSEVLEHFNFYPLPFFNEVYRVLKPGGALILTTPNLTRLNNRVKMLVGKSINYNIINDYAYGAHYREYNESELRYLLSKSNFKNKKFMYKNFNYPEQYKSVRLLNKIVGSIKPSLRPNIIVVTEKI